MNNTIVLVPVYKPTLEAYEQYSLDQSLLVLHNQEVMLIGPEGLDISYYTARYPGIRFRSYAANYFASIEGYNHLLLSQSFYIEYLSYEFMLILQTDAIVLRDELAIWCSRPFDYIGAPFPCGIEVYVNAGCYEGINGKNVRAHVGNGGLSLRRVQKCLSLIVEHSIFLNIFSQTGSSEDLFFSLMGQLSQDFVLPNEIIASHFSLELRPSYYFQINGEVLPMGGHAWWKYEPDFWSKLLPDSPLHGHLR
ncbi:MAG: hypothetical protein IPN53_19690 [Comamonadaceae bacterium]|nr:hypothetical protein [Comamonadaceae bacterium]